MLDIGIFNNPLNSNKLEVRIRPSEDVVNGVYSAGVFTIRFPISYGVTLVAPTALNTPLYNYSLANQGTDGTYRYYSFSFVSPYVVNWTAGNSYTIAIIQISSGTTGGTGIFEIVNNAWTVANNGNVYQELNGGLANGIIYQPSATAPLIPVPPDTVPPSIACAAAQTVGTTLNACTYTHSGNTWDAAGSDNYPGFVITYTLSGATTGTAFSLNNTVFNKGLTTITAIVRDGAGLSDTCAFTVTVNDLQPPAITAPPAITISANAPGCKATNVGLGNPVISDNCGTPTVTNNAPAQFPSGNTTVVWRTTDAAGLTATATQIVTVQSTLAVSAVNVSSASICQGSTSNLSFAIMGGVGPYSVVYQVNDDPVTVNDYVSMQPIVVSPAFTSEYRLVSVTDAVGCSASPAGLFKIIAVKSIPTLFALTPSAPVVCGGAPIALTATGLLSNSSNIIQYTFNGTPATQTVVSNNLGAGDLLNGIYPAGTYTVSITAISVAGCSAVVNATAIFKVDTSSTDCSFYVSGHIRTYQGLGVKDVSVELQDSLPGGPLSVHNGTTGDLGAYSFLSSVPPLSNCKVTPYKNDNPLNGVTTLDLVLITKHLLGLQPFTSPYQIIAADANRSGLVTTLDVVELRKIILGIYESLPSNTSWRFVDSSYVFPTPDNPFSPPFPENIAWDSTQSDHPYTSFIGIKTGDVNGSVIASLASPAEERTNEKVALEAEVSGAAELTPGEEFLVTMHVNAPIDGFQFTLEWEGLELLELIPGNGMSAEHFGVFEDAMTCSYSETGPLRPGFTLRFRVKVPGGLSDKFYFSNRITPTEVYRIVSDNSVEIMGMALNMNVSEDSTPCFQVFPNRPNPFESSTFIQVFLPEAGLVAVTIWDAAGRQVWAQERSYAAGFQMLEVGEKGLPAGVLMCQVKAAGYVGVVKMIKK